ncbi:hypothetical protein HELRODRAFT_186042 [Helobdella robusta]|uniref:tRNA-queuosine alpha-mannosyltransferase n=1 Tax=Helobdella robusta TaxID=6412 RepID=T1FNL1_HELRO|nr:hypothetical protein HELRODRAFT_186042 [Helobdella robusta]ESN94137.1 hypothetical protein HELRODRAFT_186042 [Helobdella robusta]
MAKILLIEPFYGGSHKQLIDLLFENVLHCGLYTQTAKKWHWRSRTSALHFADVIPFSQTYEILFCSSVLNLTELVALRPDLYKLKKIIYFHENQLVYPVRKQQERDFQYGYNQILSCLVADVILFNSDFNRTSFLGNIKKFFKLMPDYRPMNIEQKIMNKCRTLYFPVELINGIKRILPDVIYEENDVVSSSNILKKDNPSDKVSIDNSPLKIVWPHRWEHDKNPQLFLKTLKSLTFKGLNFDVYILGQSFSETDMFDDDKKVLERHIKHCGFVASKEDYFKILSTCDVVISTAVHEFFGVAMIEAAYLGCFPLVPNILVYPEIFPTECLYKNEVDLIGKLESFCQNPKAVRNSNVKIDFQRFSWDSLKNDYFELLNVK